MTTVLICLIGALAGFAIVALSARSSRRRPFRPAPPRDPRVVIDGTVVSVTDWPPLSDGWTPPAHGLRGDDGQHMMAANLAVRRAAVRQDPRG